MRSDPSHQDFNRFDKPGCIALENVLKAYSNYDREIGYVQGMNYIATQVLKYTRKFNLLKTNKFILENLIESKNEQQD